MASIKNYWIQFRNVKNLYFYHTASGFNPYIIMLKLFPAQHWIWILIVWCLIKVLPKFYFINIKLDFQGLTGPNHAMFCFRSLLKVINKYISHVKKNSERLGGKCIILSKLYLKLIILDRYIYIHVHMVNNILWPDLQND